MKKKHPTKKILGEIRKRTLKEKGSMVLPKKTNPVEKLKHEVCQRFIIFMNDKDLTQEELAKKIGIDKAKVSKIVRYKVSEFTVDRLIRFYSKINPHLKINVA
jgi:predicted XRE-type DNA-binding protein